MARDSQPGITRRDVMRLAVGAGAVLTTAHTGLTLAAQKGGRSAKPVIRTVLGDVEPDALGVTLFHEHLSMSNAFLDKLRGRPVSDPPVPHFTSDLSVMTDEMKQALADGVTCICEGGHADQGRSITFLRELSKRSGMAIIASGGYHTQPSYPEDVIRASEDDLVEVLVRDARAERWGAMGEVGFTQAGTADERKVFRAIGKAQLRTGLPIFTHTANGLAALEQLDMFESVGVAPERVCIGHLGNLEDSRVKVHKEVARRGAFVGFDRLVRSPESDAAQLPMIKAMIDAGYIDRLLFSSDIGSQESVLKSKGGPGYAKALTVFVPQLRKSGVGEAVVKRIVSDNPRRFLSLVPKDV